MRILDLTWKDLKQMARDWKSALFLIVMPIVFTLLLGFVFSGTGGDEDPRLPVGFLDEDRSAVTAHLHDLLRASDAIRLIPQEEASTEALSEQVTDGDLAAALVVPAGYGQEALTSEAVPGLVVIINPSAEGGQAAQNAIQAAALRLTGAAQAARLSARALEAAGGQTDGQYLADALDQAVLAWKDPPLDVAVRTSATVPAEEEAPGMEPNTFAHSSAGVMVQFAMAGLMAAGTIMVLERKSGALHRLLTTAISRLEIIMGHYLAMIVMILGQLVLLILFGQWVLGVPYLQAPLGTAVMAVTTTLWSASLGLLVGVVAQSEEQVIMLAIVLMLVLAGLGGAWMPLELTSETFQTIGHLTPVAWAMDGFENLIIRGLGLDSVWLPAIVLMGYALVLFGLAVWRFRFE